MRSGWVKTEISYSPGSEHVVFESSFWCVDKWIGLTCHSVRISDVINFHPDTVGEAIHDDAIRWYLTMERE